jgi:glycosyltransferase involved in cell wall biosynthesis
MLGMHILLSALSCSFRHGSEALVGYKYAEALSRRHAVTVLAASPVDKPPGATTIAVSAGKCNFNDVSAGSLARFEIEQLPRAWQLTRSERFDVVHRITPSAIGNSSLLPSLRIPFVIGPLLASTPPPASFDHVLRRSYTPPSVGRLHPCRVGASLAWRARDWLARRQYHLRSARKIIVGTRLAWEQVPAKLRHRCELLPYSGVEHDFFLPPTTRAAGRPLQLLYVGRPVPYKGLELLLRAVALATGSCDLQVRIVGMSQSPFEHFCRRLAEELGLASQVHFVASVGRRELLGFYQETDLFCFPTLCDTYGIALLEAMSCGCPIIASDTSGAREIVDESFGIKVPLTEPEKYVKQFAESIIKLGREPGLRNEMGRNARRRVETHHDWATIASRLLGIYEKL